MNASKEAACAARETLQRLGNTLDREVHTALYTEFLLLHEFLDAAERRLPSEAAIARDKERRKKKIS